MLESNMRRYKANKYFGKKVQKSRKKKGLSQEDLAGELKISRNHVGRIERGEVNITLVLAQKICRVLKVKSSELLNF